MTAPQKPEAPPARVQLMPRDARRTAWRMYACASLAESNNEIVACETADRMLRMEEQRFGREEP